ncbi:hypothetical protein K3G63_21965 [Hymenobacter sp. HSC-4F20]|nr:hypothetical protein [Hymenobacter sp. HSC-4F20]
MAKQKASAQALTDEEVLKEFVRRFECDGAVLIYLDSSTEFGFGRWRNSKGKHWAEDVFKRVKQPVFVPSASQDLDGGVTLCLTD